MNPTMVNSSNVELIQPEGINNFRKFENPGDHCIIPETCNRRQRTDFKFLLLFAFAIVILVPFLAYTLANSDIARQLRADSCGNICGKDNSYVTGIPCSGKNFKDEPFLQISSNDHKKCVTKCDANNTVIFGECFPGVQEMNFNNLNQILADLKAMSGYIVLLCLIGLCLNVGVLFLFRYFTGVAVWGVLIGSLIGILCLTGVLWYFRSNSKTGNLGTFAYFMTIVSIIAIIMLLVMLKRINLIIQLFKEAIKNIFGIPLILFEPLLSLLARLILLIIGFYLLLQMSTAGYLQEVEPNTYEFVPNGVMNFTFVYHLIIVVWMGQFIIGCEHMVISGSISAHYFARDKNELLSPIYNSFYNLIVYHLGTVALGSFILTLVIIIKALIRVLMNNRYARICIICCLNYFEGAFRFLSKNAYIQTAMHGQPFFKSGKRAVHLLATNALSTIAVNSVGDFILFMTKISTVLLTIGFGVLIQDTSIENFWIGIVIAAIITYIIADSFFTVFETAVDTIFLCFCEDCCMNDGTNQPYYMSMDLMQYVEQLKAAEKKKNNVS